MYICILFAIRIFILDNSAEIKLDGEDRRYTYGGIVFTVGSVFSKKKDAFTITDRFERYIKANASQLTADSSGVIIDPEYGSAVGKEQQ